MLTFLKKPSDKSTKAILPAWHPNFRNFDQLPDIKVVRTTFFVNGAAVLVALSLIVYTIYKELELSALVKDTQLSQEIVLKNQAQSNTATAQFIKFQDQEKKVYELQQFLKLEKVKFSDFLLTIGETLQPSISLSSIDYKSDSVTLRGGIKGSSEEAAKLAQTYVDDLRKTPYLVVLFDTFTLVSIVRDSSSSEIRFEIDLKFFKGVVKPAGKIK